MKIERFKLNEMKYNQELGYDYSISDYLSSAYQLWSDAEGLPQLSADEHDMEDLTPEQQKFINSFIDIWEIVCDFEREYFNANFLTKLKARKYNI